MKKCKGYVGVSCIDGSCPMANYEEYEERDYDLVKNCRECYRYRGCVDCTFFKTDKCGNLGKQMDRISNVKVGNIVVCFDEYKHDFEEHLLKVKSIEKNKEEGILLYGEDITYPEEENIEDCILRVSASNFLRVLK